jgi:hypothetical protein
MMVLLVGRLICAWGKEGVSFNYRLLERWVLPEKYPGCVCLWNSKNPMKLGRGYQDFGWGVGTRIFYVLRSQDMENWLKLGVWIKIFHVVGPQVV